MNCISAAKQSLAFRMSSADSAMGLAVGKEMSWKLLCCYKACTGHVESAQSPGRAFWDTLPSRQSPFCWKLSARTQGVMNCRNTLGGALFAPTMSVCAHPTLPLQCCVPERSLLWKFFVASSFISLSE